MYFWRIGLAALLLAPAGGCKDSSQDSAVSQALAQAASAQAMASAVAAQARTQTGATGTGQPADNSLSGTVNGALAEMASAQAVASAAIAQSQTVLTGRVRSTGGELGTWDIDLAQCQSGQVNGFYGVDFFVSGSSEVRVRYVHDEAAGDVVKVAVPSKSGSVLVFDRAAKCSVLEGSLEKTNFNTWTPRGNIQHLNGHMKFDCAASGGKGHVSGEATFTHCH